MNDSESLAHTKWECKVPCGLDSQVPAQGRIWGAPEIPRARLARPRATARGQRRGGPSQSRPRAHVGVDSPEVCREPGGRLHQREECDLHCPDGPWGDGRTSRASSSGPAATTYPRSDGTRPRSGRTSKDKRRRTSASTNSRSSRGNATLRWRAVCQPL